MKPLDFKRVTKISFFLIRVNESSDDLRKTNQNVRKYNTPFRRMSSRANRRQRILILPKMSINKQSLLCYNVSLYGTFNPHAQAIP